jgi:hypothetical protein
MDDIKVTKKGPYLERSFCADKHDFTSMMLGLRALHSCSFIASLVPLLKVADR